MNTVREKRNGFSASQLHVESPGIFTTVQDKGRIGFQQYGMPSSGAMDQESYLLGQALVGNEKPVGALECTLVPPTLTCHGSSIIAFTGADMMPTINSYPVPLYIPFLCNAGDIISGSFSTVGMRMYISFSGGINVPVINNSVSTHTKAGIGGYKNRKLEAGDTLSLIDDRRIIPTVYDYNPAMQELHNKGLDFCRSTEDINLIRVILGPQEQLFTREGIATFMNSIYTISSDSDRMGLCLRGDTITHKSGADIVSDGVVFGSVQVPADGQPIILMADRQTTGGYAKIATVITPDLPKLAQLPLGSNIQFTSLNIDKGQKIYKAYHKNWQKTLQLAEEQHSLLMRLQL